MATKMYTASFVSLRVFRNRTAAASPARLKASARLFWTTATIPATASGSRITVCTTDGSYPTRCLVSMYTRATGITSARAPIIASAVAAAGVGRGAAPPPPAAHPSPAVVGRAAQRRADRHVAVRVHQDHVPGRYDHPERQHLRKEVRDLAGREVHDGEHEFPEQVRLLVVLHELSARALHAQRAEVDPQLVSGLLGLREVVESNDLADPDVDPEEVVVGDVGHVLFRPGTCVAV